MDFAFNKDTKELVSALYLAINPSYKFIENETWYADPNTIDTYDSTKIENITKIEVRYRKGNPEVMNRWGTQYIMPPCFFIPNRTELGINLIPESKEHLRVKNWIYNRILNKKLIFKISEVNKPYKYDNLLNITNLDINYNKVGIEANVINNKINRADIIIPFNNFHSLLGMGIVIEVQFSKQYEETTIKRSSEWAYKGYSICWLFRKDFERVAENFIELKEDNLELRTIDKILADDKEKRIDEVKTITQIFSRQIDAKMKELNYPFSIGECKKCRSGYMTKKRTKTGKEVYGCSNYPTCNHSIWIN